MAEQPITYLRPMPWWLLRVQVWVIWRDRYREGNEETPMNSLVGLMRVKTPAHNMYGYVWIPCSYCFAYTSACCIVFPSVFPVGFPVSYPLDPLQPYGMWETEMRVSNKNVDKLIYHLKWHPNAIRFHVILHCLLRRLWRSTNLYRARCMGCRDHSVPFVTGKPGYLIDVFRAF